MDSKKISKLALIIISFALVLDFCRQDKLFAQGAEQDQAQPSVQQQQQGQANQPPAQGSANGQAAAKTEEIKKTLTAAVPVLEIKRLESEKPLYSIELREVQLIDLFRVIAHDYNLNILMDQNVAGTITASFTNISLEEALDAIAEMSNLKIQKKGNIVKVSMNLVTQTIVLKYIEAKKLLDASAPAQASTGSVPVPASSGTASSATAPSGAGLYGLLSEKGKILLGQQQNSLTVIDYPDSVKKIEDYLSVIDHKMETRIFKLKYLKANELVGAASNITTIAPTGTGASPAASSSSSGSGTSK